MMLGCVRTDVPTAQSVAHLQPRPSGGVTACATTAWSAPVPLAGNSATHVVARYGSLAVGPDVSYIVGNNVPAVTPGVAPNTPFSAWALAGTTLGQPSGRHTFAYPKGLRNADGRLDVLWADVDTTRLLAPGEPWPPQPLTSLWTATYARRRGWSTPIKLYDAADIGLRDATPALDASAGPVLSVPIRQVGGDAGVLVLHSDGSGFRSSFVHVSSGVAYATMAVAGPLQWLAYVAAAPPTTAADGVIRHDVNSVLIRRSSDRGVTWAPATVVSQSGSTPAYSVRLLRAAAGGRLHLVWTQTLMSGGQVIRHVTSADSGVTWSAPDDLGSGASLMNNLRAAFDACGAVHVVYEDWTRGGNLTHAVWNGGWSGAAPLFPVLSSADPDLSGSTDGRLVLVFIARPAAAPIDAPFRSYYAVLAPL